MLCPSCSFENPDGMNFCGKCGTKLELICPSCNFVNPPDYGFCGKCGNKLFESESTGPSSTINEKLIQIQSYLPEGLTEKVLAQRNQLEGEQKTVTVMFCDLVGYTSLSTKLGHEKTYTLMDGILGILIHKVHEFGGTVNQLTGDGCMALFGAPIAQEHATRRAIRASLAIHREMTKYNEQIKEQGIPVLMMRIGINCGTVVVGKVGNDLKVEFTAVGDTTNLASRMEGQAEPGTTFVTEEVFKLTEPFFEYEFAGKREIKGKESPIGVYRVITESGLRTRFDVSASRGLTPLVGRAGELEILKNVFKRVKDSHGHAVSIVGEAGIGKSRLLYELRKNPYR